MSRRLIAVLAGSAAAVFATLMPASAAPTTTSWTCSASAASVLLQGGGQSALIDPVRANTDPDATCQAVSQVLPEVNIDEPVVLGTAVPLSATPAERWPRRCRAPAGASRTSTSTSGARRG
jgi:hypothetical protein